MVNYKRTGENITKDGHTMFHCDIVKELKRKVYLEQELEAKAKEIFEIEKKSYNREEDLLCQI